MCFLNSNNSLFSTKDLTEINMNNQCAHKLGVLI